MLAIACNQYCSACLGSIIKLAIGFIAKAMRSINNMRLTAAKNGYLSDEEIEAEISAYRQEKDIL
jgi:hypothetical protein